ncbi:type VI secretion system Vgr family protein [Dyella flava]|uniref:Type VI secretion system tip protein VgrG n=1 Tax=Dyella flava TaxID=1920170 RepID=A0ABS2K1W8_9GAMM|nr:type VI secretion system Vgr family protein [Dyella flava]MBM7125219.1 type VI secretion system tip protein VgrG [Dyella flava]GLQ50738.1 type IV secretion protein Rhs [Dyella flava]
MADSAASTTSIPDRLVTGKQCYFVKVMGKARNDASSVVSFEAVERMGEPYCITVEVTHPVELERANYLGKDATFSMQPRDGEPRVFSGCLTQFSNIKKTKDGHHYRFVIEPHVARLRLTRNSRVFRQKTAPEIIEAILRHHGFKAYQFVFKLRREYPRHRFRLQYQIDDWSYIRVLMEQEGLYGYTVAGEHGDELVFADDIDHYLVKPGIIVPYRENSGLSTGDVAVLSLQMHTRTVPQSFLVADYNPDTAPVRSKAEANVARQDTTTYGQSYVYGTGHGDQAQATWEAQLRHEAAIAWQIQYAGESTDPTLQPARVLRMDLALPDAPYGQLMVEVVHSGARDRDYRNTYKAIPSDRRFRLPLREDQWPKIAGSLTAWVTSPGQYKYAYLTKEGHYVVRLMLDFAEWNPGGECVPLRLAKPFAGKWQTGFHMPALDGDEAIIEFHNGNPNAPYIAGFHHNSQHPDPINSQNRWLSRNVIRTQSNNKLRMEDWEGQEGVKLSTDHSGKSQLNLGYLVDSKRQHRGSGLELRTDAQGAVRAGGGVLVSADKQERASGKHTDMTAALDQMAMTLALVQNLADAARLAHAEVADLKAENQWLKDSVGHLNQAVIALSAPHGIAAVTPDRVSVAAGKDMNLSTRGGFNLSAMKSIAVAAADTLSLFAHKLGIKLLAARGKVQIQAQSDAMELIADQNMQLTSANGTLTANAANGVVIQGGGSAYIKVHGDDIELGGNGNLILKLVEVQKSGPAAMTLPQPRFPQIDSHHDEKFILSDQLTGHPLAQRPYRIQLHNGQIVEGETNDKGETSLSKSDVAQGLTLTLPKRKEA